MKNEVIQRILSQCEDEDSFMVQLHVYKKFDATKYASLVADIKEYQLLLGNNDDINRRVVNCFFHLIEVLERTMRLQTKKSNLSTQEIEDAHAEIWNLIDRILTPSD